MYICTHTYIHCLHSFTHMRADIQEIRSLRNQEFTITVERCAHRSSLGLVIHKLKLAIFKS